LKENAIENKRKFNKKIKIKNEGQSKEKKKDGDDESEVQWLHSYIEIKKETEMN